MLPPFGPERRKLETSFLNVLPFAFKIRRKRFQLKNETNCLALQTRRLALEDKLCPRAVFASDIRWTRRP